MDDAIDPRIGRRYRIAVRLILYPLALGLIVVAWHHRPGGSEARASDYVAWSGVTAQGQDIRVSTADGVITSLSTHVAEPCSDGSTFSLDWAPAKRSLVQTGHTVQGGYSGPGHAYDGTPVLYYERIQAYVGEYVTGTITAKVDSGTAHCRSGPVTFSMAPLT